MWKGALEQLEIRSASGQPSMVKIRTGNDVCQRGGIKLM
jgi:hypothetical protein